ncbi:MAG: GTP-binding protein [Burkholderiaceae bacterium]
MTLVAGPDRGQRTARLRERLASRPAGERWAVVSIAGVFGLPAAFDGADAVVSVGGCPCCSARVIFEVELVRLLRRGPWHRLLIEVDGAEAAAQLRQRLAIGPLGEHLRVDETIVEGSQ